MFIATLVILAVFGLIILSVIWLTPPEETGIIGETITFDDFFTRKLAGETFNGTWISGEFKKENCSMNSLIILTLFIFWYKVGMINSNITLFSSRFENVYLNSL